MSDENNSESSTSESEVSACSSTFNPVKALYSSKVKIPVETAPMFENIVQYEAAQKIDIIPVGEKELVQKREDEKEKKRLEEERLLEEKNKRRFAQYGGYCIFYLKSTDCVYLGVIIIVSATGYPLLNKGPPDIDFLEVWSHATHIQRLPVTFIMSSVHLVGNLGMVTTRREYKARNVLTRIDAMDGPLGVLKECVEFRLRVKIVTRNHNGVRGVLHATLVAFDKQWNMALSDVLEIWKRKGIKKRKVPPGLGTPVPKGTAATISSVPVVTETPLGKGVWECARHIPQMMVRGEHVVLVNIVER